MSNAVAIYARVSTEDQAERQTIESQLHACREYAAAKGYTVVAEFCDEGVSGAVPFEDRPQAARLLAMAADKIFARTLLYCVDRLARDVVEAAVARKALEAVAPPEFVTQSFDGTPEGELGFNMFAAIAQYERKVIARRTKLGRHRRVRDGAYMASIPAYGYRRGPDGAAEVVEEEAAIVRQIFGWSLDANMGAFAIRDRLNSMGVAPPRSAKRREVEEWGATTIAKILGAERYVGNGKYGPEEAAYPPIIDPETFAAARQATARRKTIGLSHFATEAGYLLAGMTRCRYCGAMCTGGRKGRNRRRAYTCNGWRRGRREGHGRYYWWADEVEDWVQEQLRALVWEPEVLQHRVEAWLERELSELQPLMEERERLRRLLDVGFPEQEARVLEHARKGIITEEQLTRQLAAVAAEREGAEARLEALAADRDRGIDVITDFKLKLDILRQVREGALGKMLKGGLEGGEIKMSPVYAHNLYRPAECAKMLRELGVTVYLEPAGGATIELGLRLVGTLFPRS